MLLGIALQATLSLVAASIFFGAFFSFFVALSRALRETKVSSEGRSLVFIKQFTRTFAVSTLVLAAILGVPMLAISLLAVAS